MTFKIKYKIDGKIRFAMVKAGNLEEAIAKLIKKYGDIEVIGGGLVVY